MASIPNAEFYKRRLVGPLTKAKADGNELEDKITKLHMADAQFETVDAFKDELPFLDLQEVNLFQLLKNVRESKVVAS